MATQKKALAKKTPAARRALTKKSGADARAEIDRQLDRYRSMRDFSGTREPSGKTDEAAGLGTEGLPFVIQKHAATRLHYDFRLGWRGVLKSWAVAKGPSYVTRDRRLAVEVEDHPMEYGGFEGAIPKGQYGGGTVMVWDQGTWEPVGDVDEGLRNGSLKFALHGSKLNGRWTLVRMGGRAAQEAKPNWLLIKEHDGNERPAEDPPITEEKPDSVVTGRSLDQIAAAEDHVWQSHPAAPTKRSRSRLQQKLADAHLHGTAPRAKASARKRKTAPAKAESEPEAAGETHHSTAEAWLASAPETAMPGFVAPQLATASEQIPSTAGWLHELKLDGYRIQAHLRAKGPDRVQLFTRSGLDWTHRMKAVAKALGGFPAQTAILDGEVVVLDGEGQSSFAKLQAAFENGEKAAFTFFAFDLLYLNGHDLRALPLSPRKSLLGPLVRETGNAAVQLSEHLELPSGSVYARACELGAEGIVSKRADGRYNSGRTRDWIKLKCTHRQEFVIAGFTLPKDRGAGLGSLLLGYWKNGKLVHCGRCGTGFTQASARGVRSKLETLRQAKPAYGSPLSSAERKDAIWVRPELVCEVQFATWTADGSLRHASFQGLREDKPAGEVTREKPVRTDAVTDAKPEAAEVVSDKPLKRSAASVKLTHPDKVLDAETGVTKQQLADYFEAAAAAMLPHLLDRPVSIVRCPDGTGHPCFFQKHRNAGLPAAIASIAVPDKDKPKHREEYIAIASADALVSLAQLGVLELHPWGSQAGKLEQPDRLIFDLDPDESLAWNTVADSARQIRSFLGELGLTTFVKTTGGKGLHIVAALEPSAEWAEIRLFARGVAAAIESSDPKLYLIKMTKAARKGRIFLDWMRNERGATAIAPWSPRARAGMRVALPLRWEELADGPPVFSVANFSEWQGRLESKNDPWSRMRPQALRPEVLQAVLAQSSSKHPRR